jgi:hypothetical protein
VRLHLVIWDVSSRSIVEIDRRCRGAYCLYHRPDDGGSKHFETPVNFYETTRRNIPEDSNLLSVWLNVKFLRFRRDGLFLKRLVTCDEKWIIYDSVIRKRQ